MRENDYKKLIPTIFEDRTTLIGYNRIKKEIKGRIFTMLDNSTIKNELDLILLSNLLSDHTVDTIKNIRSLFSIPKKITPYYTAKKIPLKEDQLNIKIIDFISPKIENYYLIEFLLQKLTDLYIWEDHNVYDIEVLKRIKTNQHDLMLPTCTRTLSSFSSDIISSAINSEPFAIEGSAGMIGIPIEDVLLLLETKIDRCILNMLYDGTQQDEVYRTYNEVYRRIKTKKEPLARKI